MPLNDLSTLETLRTDKANSQDGKFLVPAILNVFKELKSNLDDCFDGLQSQLLDVIKQQEAQIAKLTTDNKELCRRLERLDEKVDSDDAYERKDSLILSGPEIPPYPSNGNEDTKKSLLTCLETN